MASDTHSRHLRDFADVGLREVGDVLESISDGHWVAVAERAPWADGVAVLKSCKPDQMQ